MAPSDRSNTSSYLSVIVNMSLSSTVTEVLNVIEIWVRAHNSH